MINKRYRKIVKKYVKRFLRKHDFFDDATGEYSDYRWVGDDIGETLEIGDYCISFDDIRLDIDAEADKETYFEYYDYVIENEKNINYRSYLMGAR